MQFASAAKALSYTNFVFQINCFIHLYTGKTIDTSQFEKKSKYLKIKST